MAGSALAVDEVTLRRDGKEFEVAGRVLVDAQNSGLLLLLARDGVLWQVLPSERVHRTGDNTPFKPFARDEMSKRILAQLPKGFDVHSTKHYLIFYDTSPAYAQWCGALFEKLYGVFTNFWTLKGFELAEPEFPLVAIVFADKGSYLKFSQPDLGDAGESIIGYFALFSNRMTMYDLTGVEAQDRGRGRGRNAAEINQILAQPDAQRGVSTIVHEATHQISFNCGLQTRLSDCPHWFSEGIAEYFETPDLRSAKGWSGVGAGAVNRPRLEQFRKYLAARPSNSLDTLIRNDQRFIDAKEALDAYAEAWALTHFLMHKRSKDYVGYVSMLSKKKPLLTDTPDERMEEFRRSFGELKPLDTEFLRYMAKLR